MDMQSVLEKLAGAGSGDSVAQATTDHVAGMDGQDVEQHLQTAAANASANGQPDVAREIGDIVSKAQSDPDALKAGAVAYVKANPQVLAQFAPSFAQGIIGRIL